jgi:hypothetical protein
MINAANRILQRDALRNVVLFNDCLLLTEWELVSHCTSVKALADVCPPNVIGNMGHCCFCAARKVIFLKQGFGAEATVPQLLTNIGTRSGFPLSQLSKLRDPIWSLWPLLQDQQIVILDGVVLVDLLQTWSSAQLVTRVHGKASDALVAYPTCCV